MISAKETISKMPSWETLVKKYQNAPNRKSIWQLCNSFLPFLVLWYLMFLSIDVNYWITLLLALPAAGFVVRIFIIQHDCGHGSFFKSKRANGEWPAALFLLLRITTGVKITPFIMQGQVNLIKEVSATFTL